MPTVYVYNGPDRWIEGNRSESPDRAYIRRGQYFFYMGRHYPSSRDEWVVYTDGSRKLLYFEGYATPVPNLSSRYSLGSGFLQFIGEYNASYWGSVNRHSASGGSMYDIRTTAYIYNLSGTHLYTIKPGDVVIIGKGTNQGTTGNYNRVRIWGFRRGGRNGTETRIDGYITSGYLNPPASYVINTY